MMTTRAARYVTIGAVILGMLASAGPSLAGASFVRVKVDTANVREGPGTRYDRSWRAFENDPLQVLARRGRWLKTRDFLGEEGWIYAPLTDKRGAAIVKASTANVRSGPGTNHDVVFTADRGVPFLVLDDEGRWLRVKHSDGDVGWIHESLVWGDW